MGRNNLEPGNFEIENKQDETDDYYHFETKFWLIMTKEGLTLVKSRSRILKSKQVVQFI